MSREAHVRFWERAGVRLPRATRLPLYRQYTIYARAGVELDRSTLADWVGHGAALLQALADGITRHVKAGSALHADDTPVPVLDPGRQQTKTGRLWVLVRDERPWGGPAPPSVTYLYSPDRPPRPAGRVSSGDRIKGLLALDRRARAGAAGRLLGLSSRRRLCRLRQALRAGRTGIAHRSRLPAAVC